MSTDKGIRKAVRLIEEVWVGYDIESSAHTVNTKAVSPEFLTESLDAAQILLEVTIGVDGITYAPAIMTLKASNPPWYKWDLLLQVPRSATDIRFVGGLYSNIRTVCLLPGNPAGNRRNSFYLTR